jgi:glycosyltransferase involved in cell wall biosynthesis
VAFFTDSFHEVNGVALTSREFDAFARRRSLPFLSVHAGPSSQVFHDGPVTTVEFKRGGLRWNLERDLAIDLLFMRYRNRLRAELAAFGPDLVHITGPGDAGILGAILAYDLRVPLVASWHTNLHEFSGRRLSRLLGWLSPRMRAAAAQWAERKALDQCVRFYSLAQLLFAPNPELVNLLGRRTGRPAFLMTRGIDTHLFSPSHRSRSDDDFILGYVGRLSPEKDVHLLAEIERQLIAAGRSKFRILIVGDGSERAVLQSTMRRAQLPGVLRGIDLAQAYASMDLFLFPSATDTFGNVVLEAMASGVPALVTLQGGPKFLVEDGVTGYVVPVEDFAGKVMELSSNPSLFGAMRRQARQAAERLSWDAVFERVYDCYATCFPNTADTNGSPQPISMERTVHQLVTTGAYS